MSRIYIVRTEVEGDVVEYNVEILNKLSDATIRFKYQDTIYSMPRSLFYVPSNITDVIGLSDILEGKQKKLIAGSNIVILPDGTISASGGGSTPDFIKNEVPSGTLNGVNVTFTTAFNFVSESVEVFNGIKLKIIDDYTLIGTNTIQFTTSPLATEHILVNYTKL